MVHWTQVVQLLTGFCARSLRGSKDRFLLGTQLLPYRALHIFFYFNSKGTYFAGSKITKRETHISPCLGNMFNRAVLAMTQCVSCLSKDNAEVGCKMFLFRLIVSGPMYVAQGCHITPNFHKIHKNL